MILSFIKIFSQKKSFIKIYENVENFEDFVGYQIRV